ncbi:MAG: hypothetical protein WCP97_03950 [bacterium]
MRRRTVTNFNTIFTLMQVVAHLGSPVRAEAASAQNTPKAELSQAYRNTRAVAIIGAILNAEAPNPANFGNPNIQKDVAVIAMSAAQQYNQNFNNPAQRIKYAQDRFSHGDGTDLTRAELTAVRLLARIEMQKIKKSAHAELPQGTFEAKRVTFRENSLKIILPSGEKNRPGVENPSISIAAADREAETRVTAEEIPTITLVQGEKGTGELRIGNTAISNFSGPAQAKLVEIAGKNDGLVKLTIRAGGEEVVRTVKIQIITKKEASIVAVPVPEIEQRATPATVEGLREALERRYDLLLQNSSGEKVEQVRKELSSKIDALYAQAYSPEVDTVRGVSREQLANFCAATASTRDDLVRKMLATLENKAFHVNGSQGEIISKTEAIAIDGVANLIIKEGEKERDCVLLQAMVDTYMTLNTLDIKNRPTNQAIIDEMTRFTGLLLYWGKEKIPNMTVAQVKSLTAAALEVRSMRELILKNPALSTDIAAMQAEEQNAFINAIDVVKVMDESKIIANMKPEHYAFAAFAWGVFAEAGYGQEQLKQRIPELVQWYAAGIPDATSNTYEKSRKNFITLAKYFSILQHSINPCLRVSCDYQSSDGRIYTSELTAENTPFPQITGGALSADEFDKASKIVSKYFDNMSPFLRPPAIRIVRFNPRSTAAGYMDPSTGEVTIALESPGVVENDIIRKVAHESMHFYHFAGVLGPVPGKWPVVGNSCVPTYGCENLGGGEFGRIIEGVATVGEYLWMSEAYRHESLKRTNWLVQVAMADDGLQDEILLMSRQLEQIGLPLTMSSESLQLAFDFAKMGRITLPSTAAGSYDCSLGDSRAARCIIRQEGEAKSIIITSGDLSISFNLGDKDLDEYKIFLQRRVGDKETVTKLKIYSKKTQNDSNVTYDFRLKTNPDLPYEHTLLEPYEE